MIKGYVGASSAPGELERAERMIAALRDLGMQITLDWTPFIRTHGGDAHDDRTVEERALNARADLLAVTEADFMIALGPPLGFHSHGLFAEIGAAAMLALHPGVTGPHLHYVASAAPLPLFATLANRIHSSDRALLEHFRGILRP